MIKLKQKKRSLELKTEKIVNGIKIFNYDITDSTNQRAKEYAKEENAHFPAVFIAGEQTAGRGRRGRRFDSARGAGLYISFLFRQNKAFDAAEITVSAAVKVCRAIERACGLRAGIKWVNDVFAGGKKLAGILAEGELAESGYAICGIGINLYERSFPEELIDVATTLERESGVRVEKTLLTDMLIEEFFKTEDRASIMKEYRNRSVIIGKRVEIRKILGDAYPATVLEIADDGSLIVEHDDGARDRLISAEVSIKTKNNE